MSFFDSLVNMALAPDEAARAGANLDAFGRAVSAGVGMYTGVQTRRAAGFAADQMRAGGNDAFAAAQRGAIGVDQRTEMITSRALALAAAGGGGASDPTVMNIIAQIAEEGAYRKAAVLYGGEDARAEANLRADATEYEGRQAQTNSLVNGVGGVVGAATTMMRGEAQSSLLKRFGGGGPAKIAAEKQGGYF